MTSDVSSCVKCLIWAVVLLNLLNGKCRIERPFWKHDKIYINLTFMWPCIVTNFFLIKPTDALIFPNLFLSRNSKCFGQFLCPSSGVLHCTFGTGICRKSLMTAFKHVHDVLESCHQTCMTYTSAECAVENSWWWAEELPEICRISLQK